VYYKNGYIALVCDKFHWHQQCVWGAGSGKREGVVQASYETEKTVFQGNNVCVPDCITKMGIFH